MNIWPTIPRPLGHLPGRTGHQPQLRDLAEHYGVAVVVPARARTGHSTPALAPARLSFSDIHKCMKSMELLIPEVTAKLRDTGKPFATLAINVENNPAIADEVTVEAH